MDVDAFASFGESASTLLVVLLGQFNFDPLYTYNPYLGPFLFWTYVVLVAIFILSSFVAIIEEAFGKAKEDAKSQYDLLANLFAGKMKDRLREAEVRGLKVAKFAQKTRSAPLSSRHRLTLRVRDAPDDRPTSGFGRQPTRLMRMTAAMRGVVARAARTAYTRPEEERLKKAAWVELKERHKATHTLMEQLQKARKAQCALLQKVQLQQEQQMVQLEELSTQLWNAWQLVGDARRLAKEPTTPRT